MKKSLVVYRPEVIDSQKKKKNVQTNMNMYVYKWGKFLHSKTGLTYSVDEYFNVPRVLQKITLYVYRSILF